MFAIYYGEKSPKKGRGQSRVKKKKKEPGGMHEFAELGKGRGDNSRGIGGRALRSEGRHKKKKKKKKMSTLGMGKEQGELGGGNNL